MDYASRQTDVYVGANGVLKNLLGATDETTLERQESQLVYLRQAKLATISLNEYATLPDIHRFLFQDVYEWAGEYRTINMQKGSEMFCHHPLIAQNIEKIMRSLVKENQLVGLPPQQFSERAAYYLGEINMVHPFREGNGRTQRTFLSRLAQKTGYQLSWNHISQDEMIQASIISARAADNSLFVGMILRGLT